MTTEEIIIGAVAAVLVVFSLTVAMIVPKRSPSFPGKHLAAFFSVVFVLTLGTIATIYVVGKEEETAEAAEVDGGGEGEQPAETGGEAPAETGGETPTETGGEAPVETGATDGGAGAVEGDPAAGAEVFASAGCVTCHTLADAGSTGAVGPNLDEAKPSYELVVDRVTNGMGAMPAFGGQLDEAQIQDVAAYVVSATGG